MVKHIETSIMDKSIEQALDAAISQFLEADQDTLTRVLPSLKETFSQDAAFLDKVSAMDKIVAENQALEPLGEFLFDLLLMNFFALDVQKLEGDYLESTEWEEIEEKTLDRGTELLNLLLYLNECADEEIEPDLNDYLSEFLLVDDDEFQDEHKIYESFISQQTLTEGSFDQIADAAKKPIHSDEIEDLFYVIMGFFHVQAPTPQDWKDFKASAPNPALDVALYALLTNFSNK